MSNTFFISDTHFGHANIINFKWQNTDKPLRPFKDVEDMDETMVENWNRVVKPQDRVYHLGDVVMNRRCLATLGRLNGRKVLVKGNHDIFKLKDYTQHFDDIRAYKIYPKYGIICSHMPIHPSILSARWNVNVHGHLHSNHVMARPNGSDVIDPRYVNISVEQINYTPISFDELLVRCNLEKIGNP